MDNFLKNLWYTSLMENSVEKDYEKKKLSKVADNCEEKLLGAMNDEQKKTFTEYTTAISNINSMTESDAFVKGVRFAVTFMMEALYLES